MSAIDIEELATTNVQTAAPKIVVVGSINCDITAYVDDFPSPNATVKASGSSLSLGGKGLNQAVAAARAGAQVEMVACVGDDPFGKLALDYLEKNGVGCEHVTVVQGVPTGTANILVTQNAQNMIVVSAGANARLSPSYVKKALATIASADALIVQMEVPNETNIAALQIAKKNQVTTIVNPAPACPEAIDLLPYADLFTPNETETIELTGISPDSDENITAAIDKLSSLSRDEATIVITRGEHGSSALHDSELIHIPAYKIEAVDPTGAGDVFNGVLAVAMANRSGLIGGSPVNKDHVFTEFSDTLHLKTAVQYSSAAAAISVTRPLAEGAAPFADEIANFQMNGTQLRIDLEPESEAM